MTAPTRVPCSYPECGGGCAGCQPEPQQTPRPSWVDGGASGWQPIETAPKDGSAVLAFWGTDSEVEITARRYGITRWSGGTWLSVDDPDDEYIDPAFWMPLPPAPNQGEAS